MRNYYCQDLENNKIKNYKKINIGIYRFFNYFNMIEITNIILNKSIEEYCNYRVYKSFRKFVVTSIS